MKPLAEITKELADARHLERTTGLLNPKDETHRVFFVYDDGTEARAEEVAKNGDVYEAIKTLMVRVMLKKVRNIQNVRAVIVEAHANARKVPTEYQQVTDLNELPSDLVQTWETQDVVVTIGHDGETVTHHSRAVSGEVPDLDETGDTTTAQGQLAEALETLTLGVLLAAQLTDKDDQD